MTKKLTIQQQKYRILKDIMGVYEYLNNQTEVKYTDSLNWLKNAEKEMRSITFRRKNK